MPAKFKEISLNGGLISFDSIRTLFRARKLIQRDSLSLVILLRKPRRRRSKHTRDDVTIMARNTIILYILYTYTYRGVHVYFILYIYKSARVQLQQVSPVVCLLRIVQPSRVVQFFFSFPFFLPATTPRTPLIVLSKNYNAYILNASHNNI